MVYAFDALLGTHLYTIPRKAIDKRSYPLVLSNNVATCTQGAFVTQVNGAMSIFCSEDGMAGWNTNQPCDAQRPISVFVHGNEYFVCAETMKSVMLFSAKTGEIVWNTNIESDWFAPTFVDGVIWAVTWDNYLYGLDPAGPPPNGPTNAPEPNTPSPKDGHDDNNKGLSAGIIVLILFVCAAVIGGVGGVAMYMKRSKRRGGYQASLDEDGYGSLS